MCDASFVGGVLMSKMGEPSQERGRRLREFGPHGFPAYAVITDVDPREAVIVRGRTRSRARAIIIRSMVNAGFAEDWQDALRRITSFIRAPYADATPISLRTAPGEGYCYDWI